MNELKFPRRRLDGSFCVEVMLEVAPGTEARARAEIERWLVSTWVPANTVWRRHWSTGVVEELRFEQEFQSISIGDIAVRSLSIRLEGKSTAKYWRDWLVSRLLPELRANFPLLVSGVIQIRDCLNED